MYPELQKMQNSFCSSSRMKLSDLPFEIIARTLPIDEHLLDLPDTVLFPWLNLLPQRQCLKMLAEKGVGLGLAQKISNGKRTFKIVSVPESTRLVDTGNFSNGWEYSREINVKFYFKIYVDFGHPFNHTPGHQERREGEHVVFNFDLVQDLLFRYVGFANAVWVWTGTKEYHLFLAMPSLMWKVCDLTFQQVSFSHPSSFIDLNVASALQRFSNKFVPTMLQCWAPPTGQQKLCALIRSLELNFTVNQFLEFKHNVAKESSQAHLGPESLSIYLEMDGPGKGYRWRRNHHDLLSPATTRENNNDNNDAFLDFPTEWITEVFTMAQVKEFTLDYFAPTSRIPNLKKLLSSMPKLSHLSLSFGVLDFVNIPRLVTPKSFDLHIQVRISKSYFETIQYSRKRQFEEDTSQFSFDPSSSSPTPSSSCTSSSTPNPLNSSPLKYNTHEHLGVQYSIAQSSPVAKRVQLRKIHSEVHQKTIRMMMDAQLHLQRQQQQQENTSTKSDMLMDETDHETDKLEENKCTYFQQPYW
ncbi:hypothetical protein KGF57_001469 [Candida theae]|uniref:Uncharacterized protein n=1 Tax=Candida theae TaxID=1198502 RepID=A0AAD5BHI4_9ASCO|nr:uncharacterized protein KGF57_001469 [Candida theae]KAI5962735.1 hypothetical protein KGF57_001469 [Candida theae]